VPFPRIAVAATGGALTLAGASILLGFKPKWGVLAAAGFLGAVSPLMHDFWKHTDPEQRTTEMLHFSKNIALLGAGLALLGVGEPWPISLPEEQQPNALKQVRRTARDLIAA